MQKYTKNTPADKKGLKNFFQSLFLFVDVVIQSSSNQVMLSLVQIFQSNVSGKGKNDLAASLTSFDMLSISVFWTHRDAIREALLQSNSVETIFTSPVADSFRHKLNE